MRAADLLFYEAQARAKSEGRTEFEFWNNPANTITYSGMRALEEQSIVHLAEVLRNPTLAVPPEVRHVKDLAHHRDAASHPYVLEWRKKEMQEFHDQKRKYRDVRAALVWDMKKSVDELLLKAGRTPKRAFEVNVQMVHALRAVFQGCMRPEALAWTNDEGALLDSLKRFWVGFNDYLLRRAPGAAAPSFSVPPA